MIATRKDNKQFAAWSDNTPPHIPYDTSWDWLFFAAVLAGSVFDLWIVVRAVRWLVHNWNAVTVFYLAIVLAWILPVAWLIGKEIAERMDHDGTD